jgi:hypothetical protein
MVKKLLLQLLILLGLQIGVSAQGTPISVGTQVTTLPV